MYGRHAETRHLLKDVKVPLPKVGRPLASHTRGIGDRGSTGVAIGDGWYYGRVSGQHQANAA